MKKRYKIVFYASEKPREIMLAEALQKGAKTVGDLFELRWTKDYGETDDGDDLKWPGPTEDTDVACVFGVKGNSRYILRDHLRVGKGTLFFDKGYSRQGDGSGHTEYSRISVNGANPLAYMMLQNRPGDRFKRLNLKLQRRQTAARGHVLLCGSSAKYHAFHGLDDPTHWADRIVRHIRKNTARQIIYRPKPSWKAAVPIAGTSFSGPSQSMSDALRNCMCVVTHGSAAAMDAIVNGIPAVVLGESIALPVAETKIENVDHPFFPDDGSRQRWMNAVAYCQWTRKELESGEAWLELRREIIRQQEIVAA